MLTWKSWVGVIVVGLTVGVGGWVAASLGWDLWTDHQKVHALWELELRRAQAQQQQAAPGGGS